MDAAVALLYPGDVHATYETNCFPLPPLTHVAAFVSSGESLAVPLGRQLITGRERRTIEERRGEEREEGKKKEDEW